MRKNGQQQSKKRVGIWAGCAIAAVLALGAGGFLACRFLFRTPQVRLSRGLADMVRQGREYRNPVWEEIGLTELLEERGKNAVLDISLNLSLPGLQDLPAIGLDMQNSYDYEEKLWQNRMQAGVYNVDLAEMTVTVADHMLYLEVPEILDDAYSVDLATLGKDYRDSVWAKLGGDLIEEDFSYDFFGSRKPEESVEKIQALTEIFLRDAELLRENMRIEESGESREIERGGKTVVCRGILLTLDRESLNTLTEDVTEAAIQNLCPAEDGAVRDWLEEIRAPRFQEDVQLCFYLDNRDRILAVETVDAVRLQESAAEKIAFTARFTGEERPLDYVEGEISFWSDGGEYTLEFTREAKLEEETRTNSVDVVLSGGKEAGSIHARYQADWDTPQKEFAVRLTTEDWELSARGALEDIEKGESCTFRLGKLNLLANEETMFMLSGTLRAEPFTGEITPPKDAKEFLKLGEWELYGLLVELEAALKDLGL